MQETLLKPIFFPEIRSLSASNSRSAKYLAWSFCKTIIIAEIGYFENRKKKMIEVENWLGVRKCRDGIDWRNERGERKRPRAHLRRRIQRWWWEKCRYFGCKCLWKKKRIGFVFWGWRILKLETNKNKNELLLEENNRAKTLAPLLCLSYSWLHLHLILFLLFDNFLSFFAKQCTHKSFYDIIHALSTFVIIPLDKRILKNYKKKQVWLGLDQLFIFFLSLLSTYQLKYGK